MTPARPVFRLTAASLLALLGACAQVPRERPVDDADSAYGDPRTAPIVIRRSPRPPAPLPPLPAPKPAQPVAQPPAPQPPKPAAQPAKPPASAPAPAPVVVASAPKPPPEPEFPVQSLPSRHVATVQALSDAEALGPIIEKPVPDGGDAPRAVYVSRPPPPPAARPVHCKAVRSRDAGEEKIAISCGNNGKTLQTVFLQIEAMGLAGLPTPEQVRAGFPLPPGKTRQLVTLTAVSRPTRIDIFFTHETRHPG